MYFTWDRTSSHCDVEFSKSLHKTINIKLDLLVKHNHFSAPEIKLGKQQTVGWLLECVSLQPCFLCLLQIHSLSIQSAK